MYIYISPASTKLLAILNINSLDSWGEITSPEGERKHRKIPAAWSFGGSGVDVRFVFVYFSGQIIATKTPQGW